MKTWNTLLSLTTVALLSSQLAANEAKASGVGASLYVPVSATQAACDCPSGNCRPGATCNGCARLGFACVDCATPPPCSAEGICYPKHDTFGHYNTKWRRWPGDSDQGTPTPAEGDEESLLAPFDAPKPEMEDEHAPPPIEDSPEEGDEEGESLPSLEIDLPPLPTKGAPTAIPFGRTPSGSDPQEAPKPRWNLPSLTRPVSMPMAVPAREDAPPSLPESFTARLPEQPSPGLRRLPGLAPNRQRRDEAVLPVSAMVPSSHKAHGPIVLLPAAR